MSETGHIGHNLAIWGVVTASAVAAMLAFPPHWAVWAAGILWLLLWLVAILGLSDGPSRKFLSGTLRHSNYTQIYTALTRRNVMWVWGKLCDEAGDRDSLPTLFRAALTWRLYDTALLLAVAYPLVLLVGQWIVTGEDGKVGTALVLPAADFWPDRAAVLGAYAVLAFGVLNLQYVKNAEGSPIGKPANRTFLAAAAVACGIGALYVATTKFQFAGFGLFAIAFAFSGALRFEGVFAFAISSIMAITPSIGIVASLTNSAFLAASVASVFLLAVLIPVVWIERRRNGALARLMISVVVVGVSLAIASQIDWSSVDEDRRSLFLFLAVFPLLNALFDVVSYAVTLSLLRRGLRAGWPFLWGLLDLLIACALFLALGATLVAVVHGLNQLAGVRLLDLGVLFAGVRETPGAYVWLYLMLFSTIVPTALHFAVSLLGVQGLWPRVLRRPVAGWVKTADQSPVQAVGAALALGVIWTIPLIALGGIVWGFWHFGGEAAVWVLGRYFNLLLWIAAEPVGAF
ncbi:hypothetical protein RGUI_3525 [Rhodovulum sp. P5]|uniref:hypothetical protein n=1 Tax=Rhodovulum sp. P5 TaxID=1564506 RepID=UPI0009C355B6|nr:hypothetical protein [Rhodovulum sp. P5]ARE41666.1 hypothetical protein RGUI_3525 [Rhodovulum sp. P5]